MLQPSDKNKSPLRSALKTNRNHTSNPENGFGDEQVPLWVYRMTLDVGRALT